MATLPSRRLVPSATRPDVVARVRGLLPAVVTIVGVAAVLRVVVGGWYLNYDARYALLWARDAWTGYLPEFTADFAPTPHPLQIAVSSIALPFGDASDEVVAAIVLLCFGALVWLTYRLGAELFGRWVGVVAATAVLTRPAFLRDAVLAYQDVPFAALVIAAVLLEARRRRRGAAVLVLMALAGLLRPEAWVLAGLYVLYLWPASSSRQRVRFAGLALAAPVVWAATDWIVTGDPLHSLHGTAALAEEADRRRSVEQVPYWGAQYLAYTLREPLVVGVPIGLAFAWFHARRAAVLPLAVAAAMLAVFAVGPLFGLPLIGRYVRTPGVLLALFYGLAAFGWLMLPRGRSRRVWCVAGMVALAASAAWLPRHVTMLRALDARVERDGRFYGDLQRVGESPAVRRAFAACGPLSVADHRPIPYVRFWLDGPPGSAGTPESGASPLGRLLLVPRPAPHVRRFYRENFPRVGRPAGYTSIYANGSWRVYAAPGCVTRPPA
jgi:hypothetical protein